jgi:hypothetical protein
VRQITVLTLSGSLAILGTGTLPAQTRVALSKPLAESAESFTMISSIRELPSGKVLVADMRDKVVQLVDLAAGTMTKVGREGQGPGEYSLPRGLFGLPNGETLLYDMIGRRFLTIGADGKAGAIVEVPRPPQVQGGGGVVMMGMGDYRGVDAKGRIYSQGSGITANGMADSIAILRWDRTGSDMDTVGFVKPPPGNFSRTGSGNNVQVRFGGGQKVFAAAETWDVAGDGRIARVIPSPYQVIWYSERKPVKGPVQPYTPIKVGRAEKDAYMENRRKNPPMAISMTVGGGGRAQTTSGPAPVGPEPEFEETMPPFTGSGAVLATPDGEVWVLRTRPASDKIPSYDVFDRTGALVKKVALAPNHRVVGFGKGVVYVSRSDEDDLQYLQKYAKP